MTYRLKEIREDGSILLVGCGGTGGFVAEGLCRLINGTSYHLYLVDPDRVEERNLGRQNFVKADLGRFKAQVLAERLAGQFGRQIDYIVSPIEQLQLGDRGNLTIGCVDNPAAREKLQFAGRYTIGPSYSYCKIVGWYIDAGNGEHSGQVLIGNGLLKPNELNKSFYPDTGICDRLPLPTIQQPALLAPESRPRRRRDCAESVAREEQSPVINRMMADLVLTFVHKLLTGKLTWMAAYIDLDGGTMSTVDAEPAAVSKITGLTVRQLEYRPRKEVSI
jgi:PRTRC genetic system ThiF family protein